jgi:lipopolysaccharide/colanic/teichoic acid biosynthesis glycosyltransferase
MEQQVFEYVPSSKDDVFSTLACTVVGGGAPRLKSQPSQNGRIVWSQPANNTASANNTAKEGPKVLSVDTCVAVELRRAPLSWNQRAFKRAMDAAFTSVAIVCLSPVLLGIAIAIKPYSASPVLFRKTRTGCRGEPFHIFKSRTMHVLGDRPVIRRASRNDARVTHVGRFLHFKSLAAVEYDIWYAVNSSLLLDCGILSRKFFEICLQRNAR